MNHLQQLQKISERKGLALGRSDIKNDSIDFRYRDEVFSFRTLDVMHIVKCNGSLYEARIDDLRMLKAARG